MTEEELDEGREVIFENDDYLLLEVLTASVAKYYGGEDFLRNWARKYSNGNLYFLIDKTDRGDTTWVFIWQRHIEIETLDNEVLSFYDFIQRYPFAEKFFMDNGLVDPFSIGTYFALKTIMKGIPPPTEWTMENLDDLIYKFKYVKGNPKNSIVTLRFDKDEDYFKTFDISEDSIWIINVLLNSYSGGFDFVDSSDDYQWTEGNLFYYLNDENKDKINQILKLLSPSLQISDDDDNNKKIVSVLDQYFPDIGESMNSEWVDYENQARNEKARKDLEDDFCEIYEPFNIFKKSGCYWEYVTPVWNLVRLYEKTKSETMDIYGLISEIGHNTLNVGDFYDSIYEIYADDFDSEGYNRSVANAIDNAYDSIDDVDFEEFFNVYNEIIKKFRFDRWYDFPSGIGGQFLIYKVDPETAKLQVRIYGVKDLPNGDRMISLEDFYNLIYNYSLF
jgi:hypothetical protein